MATPIQIPVGPYMPDMPDYGSDGVLTALNVQPGAASFRPFPSFAAITNSLTARCQGTFFARKTDGSGLVVAGDATKLYTLSSLTFSNASRLAGGAYTTPADGRWDFKQFGASIYASNGFDTMQRLNVDTDVNFSLNTGSPPIGSYMAVVGDFLMVLNLTANGRGTVQWSAINDPTASWAASQVTQASTQVLPDGGWGQGIVGYNYNAVIFQEFSIRSATYVGIPLIFQFAKITENLGCFIPGSIAAYRDLIFFYDRSGFFMLQGGANITPIGEQKVNNTFFDLLDKGNMPRVCSAIDVPNSTYIIMFPDTSASNGNPNHGFVYNWVLDQWSEIQAGDFEFFAAGLSQTAYTLEGLDAVSTNLDTLPYSLDSAVWTGVAQRLLGGFNTSHAFGYFNGPNLAATVDTMEGNIAGGGRRCLVSAARPMVDGLTPTLTMGTRNRIEDAVTFGAAVTLDAYGRTPQRSEGRYHRGRIQMAAGATWSNIQGVDNIEFRPTGIR